MTQTYVYNEKEVYLTGRTAIRKSKRPTRADKTLHEVVPAKYRTGTKPPAGVEDWVALSDLFAIVESDDE